MSAFEIEVEGGSSVRLPTAGKYCDRDIVVTATGGGEEVFISSGNSEASGCIYMKNVVWPGRAGGLTECEYLESIYAPESTHDDAYVAYNCKNLRSVKFPKRTVYSGAYFIRQQKYAGSLEEVQIGSIGYPVTRIGTWRWLYAHVTTNFTLTVYVDAETLDGISADVTTNVGGDIQSGNRTIVYRNSTTGEVITG